MIRLLSLAMAFALAAQAQQPAPAPDLAPLVLPQAPWLKKNQKKKPAPQKPAVAKKAKKKKAPPAAETAARPAAPAPLPLSLPLPSVPAAPAPAPPPAAAQQLPLPPLVPLAPAPPLIKSSSDLGVALNADGLDAAAAARVAEGLRGVAKLAPNTKNAPLVKSKSCADDACWAALGEAQKVDQLLLATYAKGALRLQLIDVASKKTVSSAEQAAVPADAAGATASAEALACKLLSTPDCTGPVAIDAQGVALQLDGKPLDKRAPLGMHTLSARANGKTVERPLAVTREGGPTLYARVNNGAPQILDALPPAPIAAVLAEPPAVATAPAARRTWSKPVGYTALALGAAAAVTGVYFGARSKSQIDDAETAFRANGAYSTSDASLLSSGNSKARGANALFVAAGVLVVAGAVFTFAF